MKALSIKQPWLYCITDLDKRIENRTWKPPAWIIGERIALHSSKTMDDLMGKRAASQLAGFKLSTVVDAMHLGAIVATAVVSGFIWRTPDGDGVTDGEKFFSNIEFESLYPGSKWFVGPYGWLLNDVRKTPGPIYCRGALGLWNVTSTQQEQMKLCEPA